MQAKRLITLLCLLFISAQADTKTPYPELAALIVNGKEVGAVDDIRFNGTVYIPADAIVMIPGIEIDEGSGKANTPIGSVDLLDLFAPSKHPGFIPLSRLESLLKIRGSYDPNETAVKLETPWNGYTSASKPEKTPVPDIVPPSFALSSMRLDATGVYQKERFDGYGEFDIRGRAADGLWHLGARQQSTEEDPYIDQLFWLRQTKRTKTLLGVQSIQTNLLMPYTQMTGGQFLFGNYDFSDYSDMTQPTLGPTIGPDRRIITGSGPAGGTAVLRLNDRPVATVVIGLDGTYRIDLSQQNLSGAPQIEVWIYERSPFGEPLQRVPLDQLANARLLDQGKYNVLLGGGVGGNVLDPDRSDPGSHGVGVAHFRYGVTNRVTLEGGITRDEEQHDYLTGGFSAALTPRLRMNAWIANESNNTAYRLETKGLWERTHLNAYWSDQPQGYRALTYNFRDSYVDTGHQVFDRFTLGLQGRYRDDSEGHTQFLLPTVRYAPIDELMFSLYPNYYGYYRFTAGYRPNYRLRVDYTYEEESHRLSADQLLNDEWDLYFDGYYDPDALDRYETGLQWRSEYRSDIYFRSGLIYSDERLGFRAEMRHRLVPGIYARYELRREPLEENDELFALVNLTAHFAVADSRVYPAQGVWGVNTIRGNIVGHVYIEETGTLLPVENLRLLIDGRSRQAGESQGRLWLENLEPGVYEVALDPETLPMEYMPVKKSYWVQVENGATSALNFYVRVEYGAAGQLRTTGGKPLSAQPIAVYDNKNMRIGTVTTDRFGYFRVDGLAPGTYTLQTDGLPGKTIRKITIVDDFVFEQDIVVASDDQ